jgi:hypothetical protein
MTMIPTIINSLTKLPKYERTLSVRLVKLVRKSIKKTLTPSAAPPPHDNQLADIGILGVAGTLRASLPRAHQHARSTIHSRGFELAPGRIDLIVYA